MANTTSAPIENAQEQDIPEYFNPKNYTASKPDEWLEEIYYRTKLYEAYQENKLSKVELKNQFTQKLITKDREPITSYFGKPFLRPAKDASMHDILKISHLISKSKFYEDSIYDIEALIKTGEWSNDNLNTYDRELAPALSEFKLLPWFSFYENDERQQPHPAFTDGCPISIDLNFSDKEIFASLREWLKQMRKAGAKPTTESKYFLQRFKEWRKFQVIPSFDIFLWAKINEITYTHEQIGNFLWKDESLSDIELRDRVRKVITNGRNSNEQGKIDKIFNGTTLTRLWRFCEILHNK